MNQARVMDEQMARVPKAQFLIPQPLPYDVYVRLSADRFILVGRAGTTSTIHRLKAFEADLVPWFYVVREHYPRYLEQTIARCELVAMAGVDRGDLLDSLGSTLEAVHEAGRNGFTDFAWSTSARLSSIMVETALSSPGIPTLISEIQRLGRLAIRHAVGVGFLATFIAREQGLSEKKIRDLAAAGLLHDIGWLKLPEDLVSKREDLLTDEERRLYETHPELGAKLLQDCSQVPGEVVALVRAHHENGVGTGYPNRLSPNQVDPAAMILSLAERFCELTVGDGMHQEFLSPTAAVNTIANVEGNPYPKETLKILEKLVRGPLK